MVRFPWSLSRPEEILWRYKSIHDLWLTYVRLWLWENLADLKIHKQDSHSHHHDHHWKYSIREMKSYSRTSRAYRSEKQKSLRTWSRSSWRRTSKHLFVKQNLAILFFLVFVVYLFSPLWGSKRPKVHAKLKGLKNFLSGHYNVQKTLYLFCP